MKKLLFFLTVIILSSCVTVNDYPFAPKYKTGKHKTKKCKPIKKEFKLFDCSKNW